MRSYPSNPMQALSDVRLPRISRHARSYLLLATPDGTRLTTLILTTVPIDHVAIDHVDIDHGSD